MLVGNKCSHGGKVCVLDAIPCQWRFHPQTRYYRYSSVFALRAPANMIEEVREIQSNALGRFRIAHHGKQ